MISRQHVERDFFDGAQAMRDVLDRKFKDAYAHGIDWQYFCDPKMYAYLRAAPKTAFPPDLFQQFMQRLRGWCLQNLGLVPIGLPSLHLMINGCRLGLHSDFHNGTWGYVYSLTRWEGRNFSGGETLLLRDGVPSYKRHHVHGEVLHELIPAYFNQLLLFDDRIVHATPVIEGSMDPLMGRIALVGHIRATSPVVEGCLGSEAVRKVILECLRALHQRVRAYKEVQGTITCRLEVAATGEVESVNVLTDNLVTQISGYGRSDAVSAVREIVREVMQRLEFPAATGKSTIILPVLIPLPDLNEIRIVAPCGPTASVSRDDVIRLGDNDGVDLHGRWQGDTFAVREPVAGTLRVDPHQIVFSFDPPMWVPSQREGFEAALIDWAKTVTNSTPGSSR